MGKPAGNRRTPAWISLCYSYTLTNDVSKLLQQWNEGDPTAINELVPLVYPRLRAIAGSFYFDRSGDTTLQPTALVNELYLRLLRLDRVNWQDREHLFAFAARAMRTILIDHMRARGSFKRGGGMNHVPLHEELPWVTLDHDSVVELNRALNELQDIDPPSARLIELRFLLGCTAEEVADMQGISKATVDRNVRLAKIWLFRRLQPQLKNS